MGDMRLLIITQKIDKNDPTLGFFVSWVRELANHFEHITVICTEGGAYDLPENVDVYSLGKERGRGRLRILFTFYFLLFNLRHRYDAVFVHAGSIYAVLGAPLWKLWRKKMVLWHDRTHASPIDRLAFRMADSVLYASASALPAKRKNARQMPAGIDTSRFKNIPDVHAPVRSMLYIGRIAPAQKLDVLLGAARVLHEKSIGFTLDIYGAAPQKDKRYLEKLKEDSSALIDAGKLAFHDPVPNSETPTIYNAHEVFVDPAPSDYDKAVLEALACESAVLVSGKAFKGVLPPEYTFTEGDVHNLAERLESLFALPEETRTTHAGKLRAYVSEKHSLPALAEEMKKIVSN